MATYEVEYGYTREFPGIPFEEVTRRVTAALATEGFGVLTSIDVKETLKKKMGTEFRRYMILGACNPSLAHKALSAELAIGLLLPCNVTVFEGDQGQVVVQAVRPPAMFAVVKNASLGPLVNEVDERIRRVLAAV